jgi:uncharacterized membrane protein YjjB (DUF3815 family)
MTRSNRTPIAVISFAGAVTMMPGVQMYRALSGALQLARFKDSTDVSALGETLGDAAQACLVVGALTLGLIVGARIIFALMGASRSATKAPSIGNAADATTADACNNGLVSELADSATESAHHEKG